MSDRQEERLRRGDDLRLQMAIEESKREKQKPEEVRFKHGSLANLCFFLTLNLDVMSWRVDEYDIWCLDRGL